MKKRYFGIALICLMAFNLNAQKTTDVLKIGSNVEFILDGKDDESFWNFAEERVVDVPIDDPVDGVFDYDWLNPEDNREASNFLDMSATFKIAWNDTALFIYMEVIDDYVTRDVNTLQSESYNEGFDTDKVEFYLKTSADDVENGSGNLQHAADSGFYQIVFFPAIGQGDVGEAISFNAMGRAGIPAQGVIHSKTFATALGYNFELVIPWDEIPDNTGTEFLQTQRTSFMFDISLRDNDNPDENGDGKWSGEEAQGIAIWAWSENDNLYDTKVGEGERDWSGYTNIGRLNITQDVLNINDFSTVSRSVSCYPNPVKDILNITNNKITSIQITNVIGKTVQHMRVDNNNVNISSLKKGVYFIRFYENNTRRGTSKIIKD